MKLIKLILCGGCKRLPNRSDNFPPANNPLSHHLPYVFLIALIAWPQANVWAFDFNDVVGQAKTLASKPYQESVLIPQFMREISYEQFQRIRVKPDKNLWQTDNTRFQVALLAPGNNYIHSTKINIVNAGSVKPVPFQKDIFDFGSEDFAKKVPADLGFAGFNLTFPLHGPGTRNHFLVFAGASYFRGVGKGNNFGLSARGIAVDTAMNSGEKFPSFVEYWLVKPPAKAKQMTFFALLDGESLTGAYQFTVTPGQPTQVAVKTVLFARQDISLTGIAPLTSMFYYGENMERPPGNWRPEVHDSDGLLIHSGTGEWLWRPLLNPRDLQVESFAVENPKGFGLMTRDKRFESYQDAQARYDSRPSAWVNIKDAWGAGRIVLVQIPTKNETNDNIVAFWASSAPFKEGMRLDLNYELSFGDYQLTGQELARSMNTFVGLGNIAGGGNVEGAYRFVVDFGGPSMDKLAPDAAVLPMVTTQQGEILEQYVEYIEASKLWRLSFLARPKKDEPLLLRAFLKTDAAPLTETWTYNLPVNNGIGARPQ
ncbi:MAG: glucan biosynthesis protein G [Gammaproteobacteria bacterium]